MADRPCPEFEQPRPVELYRAYCRHCGYSRAAHDNWDRWTEDAQITERTAALTVEGDRSADRL